MRPSVLIIQDQFDPTSISFTLDPRFEVELELRDRLEAELERHLYGCVTANFMDVLAQVTHGILADGMHRGQVAEKLLDRPNRLPAVFKHDCGACVYLGHWDGHDLYYCAVQVTGPTVIARYGSVGPDYKSGVLLSDQDQHLWCAKLLAQERGLM